VLYGGRLAEIGTATDVLESPAHPYSTALLRSRLTMPARRDGPLLTLPGEPPDPRDPPPGCPFAPRCTRRQDNCETAPPVLVPAGTHPGAAACLHGQPEPIQAEDSALWEPAFVLPRPGPSAPAVDITGAEKTFVLKDGLRKRGRLQALRDRSAGHRGRVGALVGESGCASPPCCGPSPLHGIDAGEIRLGDGARPQMVFQDAGASLTPWMTVGELVGERLREEQLSGPRWPRRR
jgi:peptide/nickel transport system ATP-binding protein